MVISNLNINRVLEILRFVESCLLELKPFALMGEEEFLADRKNPPFVESYLRRSLEAVFDIGRHILSKMMGFKDVEYKAVAKELGQKGVVTEELASVLYAMAGYRNRMVHFYKEITPRELHKITRDHLKDLERFINEIAAFIKAYQEKKTQGA
ncbi:MAG: DUF86 domain-containing protein [Candidatus Aminicenantes bacterium]|nr:DUF86 domain-containing protein [Candidatus Aminicenantes bacterium]